MLTVRIEPGCLIAGRYRLGQYLGGGGMGTVWSATHVVTRRQVAMKFLNEALQHKADVRQRFLREASAASALRHPHVVEVIDVFDLDDGSPVMVMELLDGETLERKLARDERLSLEETAALLMPVIAAAGSAHAIGIVHRDLKPENIFLARIDGALRVKVLDFGIAKLSAEHYLQQGQSVLVTEAGAMLGTPCYMAPEQITNEGVDYRADIWSLGVIAYECLSGTRPVEGRGLAEVMARLMTGAITPLERLAPELPRDVTALVQKMLSREVKRRPQVLTELVTVLARYTEVRVPWHHALPGSTSGIIPIPDELSRRGTHARPTAPSNPTMVSEPSLGADKQNVRPAAPSPSRSLVKWTLAGAAAAALLLAAVASLRDAPLRAEAPAPVLVLPPAAYAALPAGAPLVPAPGAPLTVSTSATVPTKPNTGLPTPTAGRKAVGREAGAPVGTRTPSGAPLTATNEVNEDALFRGRK